MTRSQRVFHARLWPVLACLLVIALGAALARRHKTDHYLAATHHGQKP